MFASIGGMSEFTLLIGEDNVTTACIVLIVAMLGAAAIIYFLLRKMEKELKDEE